MNTNEQKYVVHWKCPKQHDATRWQGFKSQDLTAIEAKAWIERMANDLTIFDIEIEKVTK